MQQTSLIKRKKETFVESVRNAGINIISKFDLKNVAAIKAELPWEQVRMINEPSKNPLTQTFWVQKNS